MATRNIRDQREMRAYRLVCTGLTEEEFIGLHDSLKRRLRLRVSVRNPVFPFGPQAVHELMVAGALITGAIGKTALRVIADLVKRHLEQRETGKRQVIIYDHNDRPYKTIAFKPAKVKR